MNRIKEISEKKGVLQAMFAKPVGKSCCIINTHTCSRRQLNSDMLFDIAKALDVDVKKLIGNKQ